MKRFTEGTSVFPRSLQMSNREPPVSRSPLKRAKYALARVDVYDGSGRREDPGAL